MDREKSSVRADFVSLFLGLIFFFLWNESRLKRNIYITKYCSVLNGRMYVCRGKLLYRTDLTIVDTTSL
jgi:hypothetical protein